MQANRESTEGYSKSIDRKNIDNFDWSQQVEHNYASPKIKLPKIVLTLARKRRRLTN